MEMSKSRFERSLTGLVGAIGILFAASSALAQTVNIWPGVAPGSERWTQSERTIENTPVGTVIFNVVTPTLTAYLPERAKATGTGVIIAPGGAFVALAISQEGIETARWLQQRGIAAFVLKYRIVEKRTDGIPDMDMDTAGRYGIADGIQALKVVRQRAAEWGVSPDRIGFLGFSAGGMVASGALVQRDAALRPNFAALIYGAPFGAMPVIPAKLPPVFMAWAQDDPVAIGPVVRFRDALVAAGNKPEIHVFSSGGHGFGTRKQGTSSDHWIDALYNWLDAQGFTKPAAGATDPGSPLMIGETFAIESKTLAETRRINVYLPPVYADSPNVHLPVLYMPDGGIAEDFLHVAGLVQVSVGNGTMRPFILVGIANTQRRRDLTGPTVNAEDRKIAPQVGGSAAFRRFIRTELIPIINTRYRTTPEKAIMGESLAGLFVVETLLLEPDLFDTYVAFDPSLWWNNGELVKTAATRFKATGSRKHTLYFAGSSDALQLTQQCTCESDVALRANAGRKPPHDLPSRCTAGGATTVQAIIIPSANHLLGVRLSA
jgi:predicted alpha/beta superfamily hydrolase/acetyl esterase/lipase